MKNDVCSSSAYQVKSSLLLIFFVVLIFLPASQAFAQVSFKILDQQGNPVMNSVISTDNTGASTTVSSMAVMDQVNQQFLPHVLVIQKNQSVDFPNSDAIRHHIYSFSAPKPFEIRLFKGKESSPMQFDKPGVVVLGCNIHDQMVGYIYIAEDEMTAVTDKNGLATLATSNQEYYIWHPRLSASNADRIKYTLNGDKRAIQKINLSLLPDKKKMLKSKFGGRKFSSGGE